MTRLALAGLLFLSPTPDPPPPRHDVDLTSIARVFLDQVGERSYTLSVVDTGLPLLTTGTGVLPDGCAPTSAGGSALSGQWIAFGCERPLTFEDTLDLPWPLSGVVVMARWTGGEGASAYFRGTGRSVPVRLGELRAAPGSLSRVARHYVVLGIEHILGGADHLLFLLGLMLLVKGPMRLVKTVTAFTVAHSITLGSAVLGWVPVYGPPVEAAIALSIVLLAREILSAERGLVHLTQDRPWVVAFAFGLLHGFGFAGALGSLGLRSEDVPSALLSFNLGVEAGQLLFVAALMLGAKACARFMGDPVARVRPVAAYVIGTLGTLWFLDRLPGIFEVT